MSTTMANPQTVERKWYIIDATGIPLGKVAAKAASLLRGKHKTSFTPHVDCGDNVVIINCKDAVLTGNKLNQKVHYRHTGWIGGIKGIKYGDLMKQNPQRAMKYAVKGMLPKNVIGRKSLTRLRIYADDKHKQAAQQPEICNI